MLTSVLDRPLDEMARAGGAAVAAARAHGNDGELALSLPYHAITLCARGEAAAATAVVEEAVALATGLGNSLLAQAGPITAASSFLWSSPPDFRSCAALLERFADSIDAEPDYVACWHETLWGSSLLAMGHPDALSHLSRAALLADRLDVPPLLRLALQLIVIGTATSHPEAAAQLAGYIDAHPHPYPLAGPYEAWVAPRLEATLAAIPGRDRERYERAGAQLTRRQMLNLVIDAAQGTGSANDRPSGLAPG